VVPQILDRNNVGNSQCPSYEQRGVLGVLLDSNIYPNRSAFDHFLIRVMMGGVFKPEMVRQNEDDVVRLAQEEISLRFSVASAMI